MPVAMAVPTSDPSGLKKWLGLFLNETGLTDDEVDDFATTGGVCAFDTVSLAVETFVNGTVHLAPLAITSIDNRVANGSNASAGYSVARFEAVSRAVAAKEVGKAK